MSYFNYQDAFSRNLGLVTKEEQEVLSKKKVAIAGVGGVGGFHATTLARMGIQHFHIADMDIFEIANLNRQAGAMMSSIGRQKAGVIKEMILEINPQAQVTVFGEGVNDENLDAFLKGVDVYVDGLDYFVLDMREKVFIACQEKGIYAVTAGPIGITTAFLVFDPKGCSFKDYFDFKNEDQVDKAARFLVGLSPRLAHRTHVVDQSYINFHEQRGPSLIPACMACAAVIGTAVLKICLGRGKLHTVPWVMQFDMLQNKFHKVYNIGGNKNPINKLKIRMVYKSINK